jgi:hypothetical protein
LSVSAGVAAEALASGNAVREPSRINQRTMRLLMSGYVGMGVGAMLRYGPNGLGARG